MNNDQIPQVQPTTQAPQPAPQQPAPQQNPGKNLGVVGFVFAFVLNIVGLIISIIALNKSKKAGHKNGLALAGIIISSISIVFWSIIGVLAGLVAYNAITNIAERCSSLGTSSVFIDGKRYTFPEITQKSTDTSSAGGNATDITNTPVTSAYGTITSAGVTFTQPKDYIVSPVSKTCQTELRVDNGSATGISLTAIFVKAQTGNNDVDDFFSKYEASGAKVSGKERLTIEGEKAGKLIVEDGYGIEQATYFIEDTSGKFEASNGAITSYLIYGPAATMAPLNTILSSFAIK